MVPDQHPQGYNSQGLEIKKGWWKYCSFNQSLFQFGMGIIILLLFFSSLRYFILLFFPEDRKEKYLKKKKKPVMEKYKKYIN